MRIDHLGIAVPSLGPEVATWERLSGMPASAVEEVPGQSVRVRFVEVGGTHLEFLEPVTEESAVGRFLAKRGPGLHHVAFEVHDVAAALAAEKLRGGRLIDSEPRVGARGRRVGFVHPSSFGGVLVEFVEPLP